MSASASVVVSGVIVMMGGADLDPAGQIPPGYQNTVWRSSDEGASWQKAPSTSVWLGTSSDLSSIGRLFRPL